MGSECGRNRSCYRYQAGYLSQRGCCKSRHSSRFLVLGGGAPVYKRETKKPAYLEKTMAFDEDSIHEDRPLEMVICDLLASPNIASKRWIYEQYDTMVRTNTVSGPGPSDAAVIRLKGSDKGLAVKTDCNGRYVYLNPRKGGQIAVMEAARNVVCAGGKLSLLQTA